MAKTDLKVTIRAHPLGYFVVRDPDGNEYLAHVARNGTYCRIWTTPGELKGIKSVAQWRKLGYVFLNPVDPKDLKAGYDNITARS